MDSVRTVSDTKREFYSLYTRPIDSIYRRIVEEMLVEMHLLSVNADFHYDAVYALGVVSTFDRFMEGYRTDSERDAIFQALCQATGRGVEQYRTEATSLLQSLEGLSTEDLRSAFEQAQESDNVLGELLAPFAQRDRMKYSRLFGIGICTIIDTIAPDLTENRDEREALLNSLGQLLKLDGDKLQKDVELYRSNLGKMKLARETMAEAIAAERKKRDKRQAELAAKHNAAESDAAVAESPSEAENTTLTETVAAESDAAVAESTSEVENATLTETVEAESES